MKKLTREFYNRTTITVAQELLGKYLVHVKNGCERIGRIVEVEAYLGSHDLAAHSSKGITPRTKIMFGPPGYAYVYLIYGIHHCLNVVTEGEGSGSAVLLRAIEPVCNISQRTQGPGLLCKALEINKQHNGHDLLSETLYIAEQAGEPEFIITQKTRIGVGYAKQWADELLRFYIKDNPFVSRR
ncbi:DNA-3-methyladenine glycosylase [Legionella jordanis]|nr:DNA-3-methyladenine glycosylase [Legionella jordanis]RMX04533.1 DNA-3-methyladenine glycosylase [Legionella jordanis]RMX21081.1 DNA-3-methyladenine glycosylase [Legionella jordanis]HAT8713502.1 DNA-3-methyladenine glycosylase [Legionella jordanis]